MASANPITRRLFVSTVPAAAVAIAAPASAAPPLDLRALAEWHVAELVNVMDRLRPTHKHRGKLLDCMVVAVVGDPKDEDGDYPPTLYIRGDAL